jgi:superoxide dismutase, Cu-Zn family
MDGTEVFTGKLGWPLAVRDGPWTMKRSHCSPPFPARGATTYVKKSGADLPMNFQSVDESDGGMLNNLHTLRKIARSGSLGCLTALLLAFVSPLAQAADMPSMPGEVSSIKAAVAVLVSTVGNRVSGVVRFTQTDTGVRIVADVSGLTPGLHGFHIHEFGDMTSTDGTSAGGHFNPAHTHHGAPEAAEHHAGDLGNLTADANGHATLELVDPSLRLDGATSIVGRGIVVHADADDLKSQPVGNAGKRVAVGVIGVAK